MSMLTMGFLRKLCPSKKAVAPQLDRVVIGLRRLRQRTSVRVFPPGGLGCKPVLLADVVRADIERKQGQDRGRPEAGSVHNIAEERGARASATRPAMPEANSGNASDVFERIAQTLPPEQREEYWREMAYLKHLDPDDELLRMMRATGYLTQISQSVPVRIAEERERFEKLLAESVAAIERTHQASQTDHRQLEQRLSKLPETIAEGVQPIVAGLDSEVLTKAILEKVQQQLAGLDDTSQLLHSVSKQLREVSSELDQAVKPPQKRYSNIAVSIEGELLKLDQASARLREHAAKLAAQTRQDRWFWKTVYYLVFFAVGLVAGIAWEKTNAASLMFDLQGQVAQLQQTIKSPPSPTNSNSPALTLRQKKGGGVAVANR
jgi:hypothetical protein